VRADEQPAVAEGDAEADRPVDDRADPEDQHVLARDVAGVLHPRQACLEKREAGLHEHDEDGRDDHPDGAGCDEQVVLGHSLPLPLLLVWTNKKARRTRESHGLQRPVVRHGGAATTWGQCCALVGRAQPRRPVFRGLPI
jgi:hypothetical protein